MKKNNLKKHNPGLSFKNKKRVAAALADAILEGDIEAIQDILYGYLSTQNKKELAQKTNLSRSTIYNAVKGNPSLKTLVEILKEAV